MDIKQIRLQNMLALANGYGRIADFCEKIDMQPSYFSQVKAGTKGIGDDRARRTEVLLELPHGFMDMVHTTASGEKVSDASMPDRSAMSLAYIIEELPPIIRERIKGLVYSLASELGDKAINSAPSIRTDSISTTESKGVTLPPFQLGIGSENEEQGSQTQRQQTGPRPVSNPNDREATG